MKHPEALGGHTDKELAARVAQRDRDAFAALYERHVDALYDYASRILRDADGARDVVQNTFVKAWQKLGDAKVDNVRAWLFVVARNLALDETRRRKRVVSGDMEDAGEFTVVDLTRFSDPEAAASAEETARLVWDSAAALSPKDHSLLELSVREGFTPGELAEELGIGSGAVYTRLSRMRDAVEESVVAVLLSRHARSECEGLSKMLDELPADASPGNTRVAIRGHIETCDACQESRRHLVAPTALLGAFVPFPLAPSKREEMWRSISSQTFEKSSTSGRPSRRSRQWMWGIAAAAGIIAVAVTAILVVRESDRHDIVVLAQDPIDVQSTSHRVGEPSADAQVAVAWTPRANTRAYSVSWSTNPGALPPAAIQINGAETGTRSEILLPGSWWFALRTLGTDGSWTSTVHLGPFLITDAATTSTTTTIPDTTSSTARTTTTTARPRVPPDSPRVGTTSTIDDRILPSTTAGPSIPTTTLYPTSVPPTAPPVS